MNVIPPHSGVWVCPPAERTAYPVSFHVFDKLAYEALIALSGSPAVVQPFLGFFLDADAGMCRVLSILPCILKIRLSDPAAQPDYSQAQHTEREINYLSRGGRIHCGTHGFPRQDLI
jgi:hypothetical protein